jgi:hypothetical protein
MDFWPMTIADGNPTSTSATAAEPVEMVLVEGGRDDDKKAVLRPLVVEKDSTTAIVGDLRMIVQPISSTIRRSIIELAIFPFALGSATRR